MSDNTGPSTLYEVLGVEETATTEEIKRAYYRLVRKHRPDEDPETFKSIKEAYEILSDAGRRREFDQMRAFGSQVSELTAQATQILDKDPGAAIRLLKRAVVLAPDLVMPRVLLGQAHIRVEEYWHAEAEFRRAIDADPKEPFLYYNLGGCLWMQEKHTEAEAALNKALTLNPHYHDALLLLSQVHETAGHPDKAISILEQAIQLDRSEDFGDFDTLLRMLTIYVVHEKESAAYATVKRLKNIIPEDEDAAHYAMACIHDLAINFYRAQNYSGAYTVIQMAYHPRFTDRGLIDSVFHVRQQCELMAQGEKSLQDESIVKPLRSMLYARYFSKEDEIDQQWMEATMGMLTQECRMNTEGVRRSIGRLKTDYPRVANDLSDFLSDVNKMIPGAPPRAAGSASKGGCAVWIAMALALGFGGIALAAIR